MSVLTNAVYREVPKDAGMKLHNTHVVVSGRLRRMVVLQVGNEWVARCHHTAIHIVGSSWDGIGLDVRIGGGIVVAGRDHESNARVIMKRGGLKDRILIKRA